MAGSRSPLYDTQQPGGGQYFVDIRGLTGNIFFVDSGASDNGTSNAYGITPDAPLSTVDAAINLCTANNGDVIFVMAGHAESHAAAAAFDMDVAGITIIGMGAGSDRPTFTMTNTAVDFDLAAANSVIKNLLFVNDVDSQVIVFDVDSTDCQIIDCEVREGSSKQILSVVNIDGGSANACDRFLVDGLVATTTTAGPNDFVQLAEVCDGGVIRNCRIDGDFANAVVHNPTGKVLTNLSIYGNHFRNRQSGAHAIELVSACTGVCFDNRLVGDTLGTILDPGSLFSAGNLEVGAIDTSGQQTPVAGADTAGNFLGADNSNNAAATTNVAANENGSVLERLEQIGEATNVGTGTSAGANSSIIDAIGMDGAARVTAAAGQLSTANGTSFWTKSDITSSAIPNNTQTSGAITGASAGGDLAVEEMVIQCDGTGWAAPTNIEITTDNVKGLTGAASPLFLEVIASFGANLTVVASIDGTTKIFPFVLESGKKLFIHGDDAGGTGSGICSIFTKWRRLADGATVAGANLT